MALIVEQEDSRFRVRWQEYSIGWLPDTISNRKAILVFLRLFQIFQNGKGKPLFTFGELSVLFGGNSRQAASGHVERFRKCGSDFLNFLTRKRKVDSQVVEAVTQELLHDPLAEICELQQRVNIRLGRDDLSCANITVALEQIPYHTVREAIRKQIASGKAHYQEEHLLQEMMASASCGDIGEKAGIQVPETEGMQVSDPTSVRHLVTPGFFVSSIPSPVRWVIFCLVLYYHGMPLSVLDSWFGVHKTTILRRMLGLVLVLWPIVYRWILDNVRARAVYIDEKWLKLRGKWLYWFVVLDTETGLPVLAALLPSAGKWSCRWVGVMLKRIGKIPRVIITDGLPSYGHVIEGMKSKAKHILCHFHYQQGVTRWLKKRFADKDEIAVRKKKMKGVLQTSDKRTVRRRLEKLKESSQELGIGEWVDQTEQKLPKLLPSVGSVCIPRTTNAIERFFRAFNQFYKKRCGFFSVVSAKRELILFLVMYLFIRQPESGKAPIESIMPDATQMPLYKMINNPLRTVIGVENVNRNAKMPDYELLRCVQAQI
jgi:transposase-like protein/predicted DNA binding CopG/RHH family protein